MNEPIAIIGLGCRLPGGASDPEAFWELLRNGVDAVGEVPADRWPVDEYFDPDPAASGKMTSRWGAFLRDVDRFDARFFGLSPREAANMDPQHRLLLEVTWEALEDAGLIPADLERTPTGIFVGISTADYARLGFAEGDLSRIDAYYGTGNSFSVAAGRIAYLLGTQGPVMALDTACSSSLVALHEAVRSLRAKECALALVGGVNLVLIPDTTVFFAKLQALSPDGRCKAFDASANGYVRGEGAGAVVLKRLSAAIRDGDPIQAVIRGTAINHDGPSSGLTVPNGPAQQAVIRQALRDGNVALDQIGYIEAHGTGTPLGDPIEMHALAAVFGERAPEAGAALAQPVYVGSVKSNLGHLEAAAGIAGLIKVVLALRHRQIPPHLHFREPSPRIEWDRLGPLRVPTQVVDWPAPDGSPRLAGVSSFGFSGTNAHIILEEAPASAVRAPAIPGPILFPLSAQSAKSLRGLAHRYGAYFYRHPDLPLADAAYTAARRRAHHPHRLAVVARTTAELADSLRAFVDGDTRTGSATGVLSPRSPRQVVFVFPGQGPEWLGMGRQMYTHNRVFRETVDVCDAIVWDSAGWRLRDYFSGGAEARPWPGVEVVHTLLFVIQAGLARVWQAWGIQPAAVIGQSLGEIAALQVAGSLSLEDALKLMLIRSQLIGTLTGQGRMAMAAIGADAAQAIIGDMGEALYVAVQRGRDSVVVAGAPAAVDRFVERMRAGGVFCRVVVDDIATHCPIAEPIADEMGRRAAGVAAGPARMPFYSSVAAAALPPEQVTAEYWRQNLTQPVRWNECAQAVLADGHRLFLEISPHPALLSTIVEAAQPLGIDVETAGSLQRQQDELPALLAAAGKVYTWGAGPDWAALFPAGFVVPLPTYAWDRERHWFEAASSRPSRRPAQSATGAAVLRGQRVSSPLDAIQYATRFDVATPPYVGDHAVDGAVVVAGASHLAQLLAVAQVLKPGAPAMLRNLSFLEPMLLAPDEPLQVQVVLEPSGGGRHAVQLFSRPEDAAEAGQWTLHATALLETTPAAEVDSAGARLLPAPGAPLALEDYYAGLDAQPYQLKGSFRRLEAVWRQADGALLGRLRPPANQDEADAYVLHPGLIDSCFQAIGAAAFFEAASETLTPGEIFVPLAIDSVHFVQSGAEARWCLATLRPGGGREATIGDVFIYDDEGRLLAHVLGFHARRMPAERISRAARRRLTDWLYQITWQPQPLNLPPLPTRGHWLILADQKGLGEAVADELRRRGGYPVVVAASAADGGMDALRRLLDETLEAQTDWRGVLYMLGIDARGGDDGLTAVATADQSGLCAVTLAQALGARARPPRLWLVTQQAAGGEAAGVWQTPLWGLGRVIMNELPELRCGLIDVSDPAQAAALVDELLAGAAESQVALQAQQRLVARLEPLFQRSSSQGQPAAPPFAARPEATYLITGAFGGLGLALAQWLVRKGARHLLLVGRREPSLEAQAVLDQLRAEGVDVITTLADVAERDQLARALAALDHMPPLAGVVHAAGILDDGLIVNLDRARFDRVLRPKVHGAWHLHELTQGQALDFFVLPSSIAAVFGSPGQANHAAASAFLDGLAAYRRHLGLPGLSLNWGPWAGIGAAAGKPSADRVIAAGMSPIETDWGLDVLEHMLGAGQPQAVVMAVNWSRWFRAFPTLAGASLLADLAREHAAAGEGSSATGAMAAQLSALARPEERRDFLQTLLTRQIAQVLRLPPAQVDPDTPFGSLGFDSLMALEVKNGLERQLGLVLPVSLVWNYPTVTELTGYLAGELGVRLEPDPAALPKTAEPEADALAGLSEDEIMDLLNDKLARLNRSL